MVNPANPPPSAYDRTVPPREECVLRYVLQWQAATQPGGVFIRTTEGHEITFGAFAKSVEQTAAGLAALGVHQGQTVTVWLPNSIDMLRIWFAINWLGAVFVPINTAYRGNVLRHVIENAASALLVTCADLMPRLQDLPYSGYFRNDEATAKAWRNGWFHTGDAMKRDAAGNYFFVDRMKNTIRRRGENISSYEVEVDVLTHPAVRECVVVAVPAESEDDVLAVVSPVPGQVIDPLELFAFLQLRLAHFILPRYIRVLQELPHTPTQKVEKYRLRQEGVTADTWDREQHGIRVHREKIEIHAPEDARRMNVMPGSPLRGSGVRATTGIARRIVYDRPPLDPVGACPSPL